MSLSADGSVNSPDQRIPPDERFGRGSSSSAELWLTPTCIACGRGQPGRVEVRDWEGRGPVRFDHLAVAAKDSRRRSPSPHPHPLDRTHLEPQAKTGRFAPTARLIQVLRLPANERSYGFGGLCGPGIEAG